DLVNLVNAHGPFAVGMSGEDANLFVAKKREADVDGVPVDLGQVGDITAVHPGAVRSLLDDGRIPVASSIARGEDGTVHHINADTAASALAVALGARKLGMPTDVEGLSADSPASGEVNSSLSADELEKLLPTLDSGMLPKMEACLHAVRGGIPRAHVLDGRLEHALLLEVFTDEG